MRKKVYIFLIVSLILGGAFWFLILKKAAVTNNIPNYADTVICIDKQNIRNTLLKHYLFNPSNYFSEGDSTKSPFENIGIEITDYLVLFTANTLSKGTFFTHLNIKNSANFDSFLVKKGFVVYLENEVENYTLPNNTKLVICVNKEKSEAVLGYNLFGVESTFYQVANDLFTKKNILSKDDELYSNIKNSNNHITLIFNKSKYVKEKSFVGVNFLNGKVEVKGEVYNEDKYKFRGKSLLITDTSLLNLALNVEGGLFNEYLKAINKERFKQKSNLNIDSLISYFKPSLTLKLNGLKTISDTSISYSYDDNFNAIEEQKITENKIPSFSMVLNKKNTKAFDYFVNDSIVKRVGSNYIFTPYPLQQVFVKENTNQILLSTNGNEKMSNTVVESINFLDLVVDFTSFNEEIILGNLNLKELTDFSLHFTQKQAIEVRGELVFKNKENQAIFSLINMFKQ